MEATHYRELFTDRQGEYHLTPLKPLKEFNHSLAVNKKYQKKKGFKTVAVFRIAYKASENATA